MRHARQPLAGTRSTTPSAGRNGTRVARRRYTSLPVTRIDHNWCDAAIEGVGACWFSGVRRDGILTSRRGARLLAVRESAPPFRPLVMATSGALQRGRPC